MAHFWKWIWTGTGAVLALLPQTGRTEDFKGSGRKDLPAGYVDEAPLPEGFPPPGEPGKVIEKVYPDSRTYSAKGREGAFWKLFGYLQLRQHKMTAPVIMTYRDQKQSDEDEPGDAKEKTKLSEKLSVLRNNDDDMSLPQEVERMHFVLERVDLDKPKNLGLVRVADMPGLRVLSIAGQGDTKAALLAESEEKLRAALAGRPDLEAAGPLRLLGYNGPDVPAAKRYWELQLPVKPRAEK